MDQRSHKSLPGPELEQYYSEPTQRQARNNIHLLNVTTHISRYSQIANASDPKHRDIAHISSSRHHESCTKDAYIDNILDTMDFIGYLACPEMVTTGLLQLHSRPESYKVLKRSLRNCTNGPDLRHREDR